MAPHTALWMHRGQGGAASGVLPDQNLVSFSPKKRLAQ